MPLYKGFVRPAAAAGDRVCGEPPGAVGPGLAGAGLHHPLPQAEASEGADPLSGIIRPAAPAGGQHRDQVLGRRRVASPQAWGQPPPAVAQDPHRYRCRNAGSAGGRDDQQPHRGCARSAGPASNKSQRTNQSAVSPPTASMIPRAVTAPSPPEVLRPSYHPAGMPEPGRGMTQVFGHATRPCARASALAGPTGRNGPDIIDEAAWKPR